MILTKKLFIKTANFFRGNQASKWGDLGAPFSVLVVNFIFQRILRVNSECPWSVHYTSVVLAPEKVKLGVNVGRSFAASPSCYITGFNGLEIGDNTIFGPGVGIISANHDPFTHKQTKEPPIKIGKNCWIGINSVILPGVQIGDNTVVAAGAVVTESFGSNVLIGGVPAKLIKTLIKGAKAK